MLKLINIIGSRLKAIVKAALTPIEYSEQDHRARETSEAEMKRYSNCGRSETAEYQEALARKTYIHKKKKHRPF